MRVALVVTGGVDESGRDKIIPALVWLIEQLARHHELHVYALRYLDRPRSYPFKGAIVHDLGSPRGLRRQHAALHAALSANPPDIVHAYWALPAGAVAAVSARRLGLPSVLTLDSGEFVALPDIGYGNQLRWRQRAAVTTAIRLATALTVCTTFQQTLAARHGAHPLVIPWGVDSSCFIPTPPHDGPPWRLVQVANLNPVKNQRLLLDAFRRLVDAGTDVTLEIAGQDTLDGAIQAHAAALGLGDRVVFRGMLPTDGVAALYQRAHLSVVTSRHEAAGVVALEAAASGVATIGTSVGYLADWTPDRAVTTAPTAEALAAGIKSLLNDAPRRRRIADAAHAWTLAHDVRWTAARFAELYEETLHRHARRR